MTPKPDVRPEPFGGKCASRYEGLRQWIMIAWLGNEISARAAAARLSAVDKAEQRGEEPPDVRTWSEDTVSP